MEDDGFGWKLFAGIMILIAGTFNVIDGLVGLTQTNYIEKYTGGELPITNNIKTWSWVVLRARRARWTARRMGCQRRGLIQARSTG
jgi:hypothetical protein